MPRYPLIAPRPPRLSEQCDALRRVEESGIFSNRGPEVRAFERDVTDQLFGGRGASLAVANATLGLMIAIREAAGNNPKPGTLALMPALTFAATGQAALWAGLTPLICDVDQDDWGACATAEETLLQRHGSRIGVVIPYATFGNAIDLDRYDALRCRYGVGIVVDAAASLGTIDDSNKGFGATAPFAIVHSLHATKAFAVAEGGLIHSGDIALIDRLRAMSNFGFESGRSATLPGINAKMPEILGLMARLKLEEIEAVCAGRATIEAAYRDALPGFTLQKVSGIRRASQFMPVLLPPVLASRRDQIAAALEAKGIGTGRYFSPHLGEQPLFRAQGFVEPTPVADAICARILSLPITEAMTAADAVTIATEFQAVCRSVDRVSLAPARVRQPVIASVTIIGGGPAGTALLTSAAKRGLLPDLARSGLVVVERDNALGGGRLGSYAITSDSTATTFLSAVQDNAEPSLAALADHPAARAIRRFDDRSGVPLTEVGPLLRAAGDRLGRVVVDNGGTVLMGHEALSAARGQDGIWTVRLRRTSDGALSEQRSHAIAIATGGHQPIDRISAQRVAGMHLATSVGDRLLQSDAVLSGSGIEQVIDLIANKRAPKITVIGGSTSALATLLLLLKSNPAIPFGAHGLTLLHRRPLRPFYHSVEAAHAEGFTNFTDQDICPVSGFVYRLAGFRLEARDLVLRMLRVGGREPDPRVQSHQISSDSDSIARRHLAEADLVIAALGYRPHALPLIDRNGARLALAADQGDAMVDRHCRVVAADGTPIAGVYGIGLSAGFVPWGPMGGEPSFVGQANGLWQWQNDVGLMIVEQALAQRQARRVA